MISLPKHAKGEAYCQKWMGIFQREPFGAKTCVGFVRIYLDQVM
jgi:hypothetical protein